MNIAAFRGVPKSPGLSVPVTVDPLSGDGAAFSSGISSVVDRFLLALLTARGSRRFDKSFGCDLLRDAGAGRWISPADVFSSFASAMVDVADQIAAFGDAPDEIFESAVLSSVEIVGKTAVLHIRVRSAAGDARVLQAPVKIPYEVS